VTAASHESTADIDLDERLRVLIYLVGTPLDAEGTAAALEGHAVTRHMRVVGVVYDASRRVPAPRRPGLTAALERIGLGYAAGLVMEKTEWQSLIEPGGEGAWLEEEVRARSGLVELTDVAGRQHAAAPLDGAPAVDAQPRVDAAAIRLDWHPAGADAQLVDACTELDGGRTAFAEQLLAESRGDHRLRAHRSLVLASYAVRSTIADRWVREAPASAEAWLVYARVAALRALRAARRDPAEAAELAQRAREACLHASRHLPHDPTPFITLLMLHPLSPTFSPGPRELGGLPGPWEVLEQVRSRDPHSREGFRRLLECFAPRHHGSLAEMWHVARWAVDATPRHTDPQLLDLVVCVETYRQLCERGERRRASELWRGTVVHEVAARVFEDWFAALPAASTVHTADLSLLAFGLVKTGRLDAARQVLARMLPYAARHPWAIDGSPRAQLARAWHVADSAPG